MTSKKKCINSPSFTYTGKEQSPLRYGLSAEGYDVNSVLEGYDKKPWYVEVKNNKKVWVRREETYKITHEEPVIKSIDDFTTNATVPSLNVINHNKEVVLRLDTIKEPENIKKTTDYNIYLSYRLKQLKETSNEDGKSYFKQAIEEWKTLKSNPEELQKILNEARKSTDSEKEIPKTVKRNNKK